MSKIVAICHCNIPQGHCSGDEHIILTSQQHRCSIWAGDACMQTKKHIDREHSIQFHAPMQNLNLICSWNPEGPAVIQCVPEPSLLPRPWPLTWSLSLFLFVWPPPPLALRVHGEYFFCWFCFAHIQYGWNTNGLEPKCHRHWNNGALVVFDGLIECVDGIRASAGCSVLIMFVRAPPAKSTDLPWCTILRLSFIQMCMLGHYIVCMLDKCVYGTKPKNILHTRSMYE